MSEIGELRDYLGIDFKDEATDKRLVAVLSAAKAFVANAIGDVPDGNPIKKEVTLSVARDLYDHRILTAKEEGSYTRLLQSMLLQLRLEAEDDIQNPDKH